jgi:site-specific DNA-methyltransferase (adenine-specific)
VIEIVRVTDTVTLVHADCLTVLHRIPRASAILTDPPYGIGHRKGMSGAVVKGRQSLRRNTDRIIGDDRPFDPSPWLGFPEVLMWGADHYCTRLPASGRMLAWDKTRGGYGPKDSFSDVEFAWYCRKGAARIFHYLWKGVCQDGEKRQKRLHSAQKPIALMLWCLGFITDPTLRVVDPYMGSGSTGVAAIRAGRRFLGIEKDREIFERALVRIETEVML